MIDLNAKYIAIDTETTGLLPFGDEKRWGHYPARPFAFSFYDSEGNKEYVRGVVRPHTRGVVLPRILDKRVNEILLSPAEKVFFNLQFDLRMLEMSGFQVSGKLHDAQFLMHIVTGGAEREYGLKPLSIKYLGIGDDDQTELIDSVHKARRIGKKKGWALAEDAKADYWMGDPDLCRKYAIKDAKRTMMLFLLAKDIAEEDPDLVKVYRREMLLFPVVYKMINRGIRVYGKRINKLEKFYKSYMQKQLALADKHGGKGLNFNSHKQLAQEFFVKRKYTAEKLTPAGDPSIGGDVLTDLSKKDPLAKCIIEYRAAKHAISGFLEPYKRFRVWENGCWVIHPFFRQVGPITGRFGCGDPNLMQVADSKGVKNKADISLRPRECFGPRKNHILYMPDFSQMEVWVFAFLAQEPYMMKTLLDGKDIHGANATKVWGHLPDFKKNYSSHRALAKFLMWCKLYGGGINAIAQQLLIEPEKAAQYSQEYDEAFPEAKTYIKRTGNLADRIGWVKNPYGRKYIIESGKGYKAVNYMVQGSCADIMKIAMIRVAETLDTYAPKAGIVLTLHDELAIEVPIENHCMSLMHLITKAMQKGHSQVLNIPVPLPVDMAVVKRRWSKPTELCREHLIESCTNKLCKKD